MADPARRRMTIEEFLVWDDGTETRYELYDGQPVAMAPNRRAHSGMVSELGRRIGNRLRESDPQCRVWMGCGIRSQRRSHSYFIPDLVVSCEAVADDPPELEQPILVVEVLSDSTESTDRIVKLIEYQLVPTIREILLIDPRRYHAHVHRRVSVDRWMTDLLLTRESRLRLDTIGLDIELSELYVGLNPE
jgi:Uma2 family endonuclease